jgi:hypothetical protein
LRLLAMLVMRSGNEATGAVLPLEMEMRSALDRILGVRPAHQGGLHRPPHPPPRDPACHPSGAARACGSLFAIGTIGQVSLLNSFCHVHTPLPLTVLRVFNGLWVGALGGVVLCALWDFFGGAPEPEPEPPPQASLELDEDEREV